MSVKLHENVRVQTSILLRDLLKEIVEERYRISRDPHSQTLLRLLSSSDVTVLMPQEIRVGGERKYIDMALGSEVVFDFKSEVREFDEAERDAKSKYWPIVSKAKFFITTNWKRWRIYSVVKPGLCLLEECDEPKARELLRTQIIPQLRELKIPPLPQNVERLYRLDHEDSLARLKDVFEALKDDSRVKPLYEAYRKIMEMLYGGVLERPEEFFVDLFIRHTYMQMAVLASLASSLGVVGSLESICSGAFLGVDVALPYLNWWRVALYNKSLESKLKEVLENVVEKAKLVDWSLGAEDVFRMLYEFLIEPETRRRIGEYYTPIWLVEMMINEFDVKGRIILDPFCGSGTFLVEAFHKKVDLGESPDEALGEVVGLDINPLAVVTARAELIIAYWRRAGKAPDKPPHVYHIDTLAMWFGGSFLPAPTLRVLVDKATSYLQAQVNFDKDFINKLKASDILASLRILEKALTYSIRFAYNECKLDTKCLERGILKYLDKELEDVKESFIQGFLKHFKEASLASIIANTISSHGGNDVWAVVLISIYATILMTKFRPDLIVTNPPWIPVTEYKASYTDKIKEYMLTRIGGHVYKKTKNVLAGADIASAALGKSIGLANEGVAYIMNREQLFYHKSPMRAGIVATYSILREVLRNTNAEVKLMDFDFDVFQHGIYPAVVVIKKRSGRE
jgi:hypothetical protein